MIDKDTLEALIARRLSSHKIARELGCSQTSIHYLLHKYNLKSLCKRGPKSEFPRNVCKNCNEQVPRYISVYCDGKCRQEHLYRIFIEKWKTTGELSLTKDFGLPGPIRKYLFGKYDSKCCLCGWCEKNPITNKTPLEIDHIDGDWRNNREENFQLLCPNCHSLTPTYKALNRGKGRPRNHVPVVKPANHVSLRRRRSGVEIPLGTP